MVCMVYDSSICDKVIEAKKEIELVIITHASFDTWTLVKTLEYTYFRQILYERD